jgi:acetyl esterase/lipase
VAGRLVTEAVARETAEREEAALLGLAPVAPDRRVRYGPHPSQVVDYYDPAGPEDPDAPAGSADPDAREAPADPDAPAAPEDLGARRGGRRLIVLHGGFWRQAYDRTHLSATAAALAGRGYVVALAEYRRVGGGGGWPGTFDDVVRVVEGAWRGAPSVLLGHSAGGHLALWAARRAPDAVSRVVALAPVADLGYARALRLSGGAVDELLGADGTLELTDPVRMAVAPAGPPEVILHGTADLDVPIEVSRRYAAVTGADLRELPGVGHYAALTPGSAAHRELLAALKEPV